jgi:hypothetical protein
MNNTITEIKQKAQLYPIFKISPTDTPFPGILVFGIDYCYNEYTKKCFLYFVIYKMFYISIIFIFTFLLLLIIALPPFTLFGFPISCKFSRILGETYVDNTRYYLVPEWEIEVNNGRHCVPRKEDFEDLFNKS